MVKLKKLYKVLLMFIPFGRHLEYLNFVVKYLYTGIVRYLTNTLEEQMKINHFLCVFKVNIYL